MEEKRHDEAAEGERDDQDQEEEEDNEGEHTESDEGEHTESAKMYVKTTIHFNDDERNPHATYSPKVTYNYAFYFCAMSC